MSKAGKLLEAARNNPKGVRYDDLIRLIEALGFVLDRQSGSHAIYTLPGRPAAGFLNLQSTKDGMATPYQVTQVLDCVDANDLEVL